MDNFSDIISFIRSTYNQPTNFIPLHEPRFQGNEKLYLNECIDSTFVSSVGKYVDEFEVKTAEYVGSKYAIATANGTVALHIALLLAGVEAGEEVITQPLTFVATVNAIKHANAHPVFVDVDMSTMGMSPEKLEIWLKQNTMQQYNASTKAKESINKTTKKRIAAIVPMHTFGHPCKIEEIAEIADKYNIAVVEDSAESLGSLYKGKHTGSFGKLGIFSYNGNKTITTGGGGMIVTNNESIAKRAKHITTTAKVSSPYEYIHDEVGYNYRLTNLAAALGVAQMEQLPTIIENKRKLALAYKTFFDEISIPFIVEPENSRSNYWLNAILLKDRNQRDEFLQYSNSKAVMSRPIWELMNRLSIFKEYQKGELSNAEWLADRVVNIPSSVIL